MSDGEDVTPGRRPPDSGDRATRSPRPGSPRAPWERTPARSSGHHREGVAAAELIARLTGREKITPLIRRSADETDQPTAEAAPERTTGPIAVPAVPREIPDLTTAGGAREPAGGKNRRALIAGRTAAALIAICALAVTGAAWQWQTAKNKLLNTIAALDPGSSDIRDPNAQDGDENFLIVGVDSRIGANAEMGAGDTTLAEGSRSDTIMLVNIPANRKRVVAVSFPRDLAITPMKCQAWDAETGAYGPVYDKNTGEWSDNERYTNTKLNSAYALGGPKCLVKVIQKMSGLAINRFMAVDFVGFAKMVDALGGVEVCSTTALEDAELGTVLASAGRQTIDGHTALNYVRARTITTEANGDYGRIKRQQLFLSSLLRSLISTDTLFDYGKLDAVVNMFIDDSYVDNLRTRDLVRLGQSLQGINAGRITFVTVPTTGYTDAEGNEEPRTEAVRALFDAIIEDQALPGENDSNATLSPLTAATKAPDANPVRVTAETPSPTDTEVDTSVTEQVKTVAADPRDVTVAVVDPSGRDGLAESATTEFAGYGFDVRTTGSYSQWSPVTATTVYYSLGNEQAAATVAATLPNATIERIDGLAEVVQVVLGPDFTEVAYPKASDTPLSVAVTHSSSDTPARLPSDLTVTNGADVSCD